jgi:hypothetical protein
MNTISAWFKGISVGFGFCFSLLAATHGYYSAAIPIGLLSVCVTIYDIKWLRRCIKQIETEGS